MSRIETREQVRRIERLEDIWSFYDTYKGTIMCEGDLADSFHNCSKVNVQTAEWISEITGKTNISQPLLELIEKGSQYRGISSSSNVQFSNIKQYLEQAYPNESVENLNKAAAIITLDQVGMKNGSIEKYREIARNILFLPEGSNSIPAALDQAGKDHERAFLMSTSAAVAAASTIAGFDQVAIQEKGGQIWVTARANDGKIFKSEIEHPGAGDIKIVSETINIHDGSCHSVFEKFSNALKEFGVVFSEKDVVVKEAACSIRSEADSEKVEPVKYDASRPKALLHKKHQNRLNN